MCRQALALLALPALALASYHHPWQQYFTPPQRWSGGSRSLRIRAGQGKYRLSQGLAELVCDFPQRYQLLSNVIWERVDLGALASLDEYYKAAGEEHKYQVVTWPQGSRLELASPSPRARGLYRCLATGLDPAFPHPVTLFQDIPFYPDMRSKWMDKHPPHVIRKPCCRGHTYDDFAHHSEYHIKSSLYID